MHMHAWERDWEDSILYSTLLLCFRGMTLTLAWRTGFISLQKRRDRGWGCLEGRIFFIYYYHTRIKMKSKGEGGVWVPYTVYSALRPGNWDEMKGRGESCSVYITMGEGLPHTIYADRVYHSTILPFRKSWWVEEFLYFVNKGRKKYSWEKVRGWGGSLGLHNFTSCI